MTQEDAERLLGHPIPAGWEFVEVRRAGKLAGFFCVQGNEIHAWRDESHSGRWLTHQTLERLTAPLFARYGHITTKVRKFNLRGQAFVTRLGFQPVDADETNVIYRAERLNHARL